MRFLLIFLIFCLPSRPIEQEKPPFQQIAQLGHGTIRSLDWNLTGDLLAVASSAEVRLYTDTLQDRFWINIDGGVSQVRWIGTLLALKNDVERWSLWRWTGDDLTPVLDNLTTVDTTSDQKYLTFTRHDDLHVRDTERLTEMLHVDNFDAVAWHGSAQLAVLRAGQIDVYDSRTWEKVVVLNNPRGNWLYGLAWSPDGRKLASTNDNPDDEILNQLETFIWNVSTGENIAILESFAFPNPYPDVSSFTEIYAAPVRLQWSPDSQKLAIVYRHHIFNTLKVWDITSLQVIGEETHAVVELFIEWMPDNSRILLRMQSTSGYSSGGVFQLDADELIEFSDTGWSLNSAKTLLLSHDWHRNSIHISNPTSLKVVTSLSGKTDRIWGAKWHPDNRRVVFHTTDEIQIWDTNTSRQLAVSTEYFGYGSGAIGWDKTGRYLTMLSTGGGVRHTFTAYTIRTWDIQTQSVVRVLRLFEFLDWYRVEWDDQRQHIVTYTRLATTVWNPITGQEIASRDPVSPQDANLNIPRLSVHPLENGTIEIRDLEGTVVKTLQIDGINLTGGAISPDEKWVLVSAQDDKGQNKVILWNVEEEKHWIIAATQEGDFWRFSWKYDSTQFIFMKDGTVYLWSQTR
jgi:hypothetical protein